MKKKLTAPEITTFLSQTALLIQAGITPFSAMEILLSDTKAKEGRELIEQIIATCKEGEPFYEALHRTEVFPDYCINLIKLGEQSGNLDDCLTSLAAYYEKEETIRENIKSAITYPLIMIIMMFLVIFVLMTKVLPIFNQVFAELGSEMTGIAGSLLKLGEALNRYSGIGVFILVVLFILVYGSLNIPFMKEKAVQLLIWFPPTKGFMQKFACQRFASGMAMTLSSGIDTFASLDMVAELVGNKDMVEKITQCKEDLKKGEAFSDALVNTGIFNNLHSRMVTVGYKSGNIDVVLRKIADNYEKETDKKLQSIIAVLEPTLVIILSVIVGLILLSVILPLMGIMSSIG
ncbi:MAG: type II secretion system F family protein [Lachnospiraceae bacterium]|nr:type II secretion system F family protein [Lachnospiraceae bacterium]